MKLRYAYVILGRTSRTQTKTCFTQRRNDATKNKKKRIV